MNSSHVASTPVPASAAFEEAAIACRSAEDAYRRQAAAELARLEAARLTAFRRVRLIRILESALPLAEQGEDIVAKQHRALCAEIGWSGEPEAQREVLERLAPVCRALAAPAATEIVARTRQALTDFETWFEASRNTSFYSLFDTYVQETPVVDF